MLSVVLLTYNRLEYAKKVLKKAVNHIPAIVDGAPIKWVLASDGDSPEYMDELYASLRTTKPASQIFMTNSERGGYGKNYNLAMQAAHEAEWIMPLEDDWELLRPLNVDAIIADMQELSIGCARLGYIGYTQDLRGTFMRGSACGHWLGFDPTTPEPHVFAGHPRIEHRAWARVVGPWNEGINPGATEFEVAHREAARRHVAWPLDLVKPSGDLFAHIGTESAWAK